MSMLGKRLICILEHVDMRALIKYYPTQVDEYWPKRIGFELSNKLLKRYN
jgi:hypothetical protein